MSDQLCDCPDIAKFIVCHLMWSHNNCVHGGEIGKETIKLINHFAVVFVTCLIAFLLEESPFLR